VNLSEKIMSYQVTARKWRPQLLDELIGQEHISHSLKNAIQSNRIAHAYLFSGSRGVGKTSAARIFAKSINCEIGSSAIPCQKCSNCIEISNGNSYDVLEIDGASNRGIDQIRELRDIVKYTPNKSRFKIFIVDEVHMLTDPAFNALLKTLEEPPDHVIFIFATTEPHKVKITIRSRCQHYHFKRIPTSLIQTHLGKIAKAESIDIEDRALFHIAKAGDGSMRDSQSLFDQVIAYTDKDINSKVVENVLGVFSEENYFKFLDLLVEKDITGLLKFLSRLIEGGENLFQFSLGLVEQFRNILILKKSGPEGSELLEIPAESIQAINKYIDCFSDEQILEIIKLLIALNQELKRVSNQQYLFESSLFRLVDYENFIQPTDILNKIETLENQIRRLSSGLEIEVIDKKKSLEVTLNKQVGKIENAVSNKKTKESSLPNDLWEKFILGVEKEKPLLAAYLNGVKDINIIEDELQIVFEDLMQHELISDRANKEKLEDILFVTYNKKFKIKSIFKPKDNEPEKDFNKNQDIISSVVNVFKGEIVSEDL